MGIAPGMAAVDDRCVVEVIFFHICNYHRYMVRDERSKGVDDSIGKVFELIRMRNYALCILRPDALFFLGQKSMAWCVVAAPATSFPRKGAIQDA